MKTSNQNLRAIIIEDEVASQNLLKTIISDYCVNVEHVGTAGNMAKGIQLIENCKPDLVFLDIELGKGNAFDLLDQLRTTDFRVIITSAYADYALKAFKYEVVDYVLKPYSPKDILKAVEKVKKLALTSDVFEELRGLVNAKTTQSETDKLYLPSNSGLTAFNVMDIIRIEADGSYSVVFTKTQPKFIISKTLKDVEKMLANHNFMRPHASHLINLDLVRHYNREDGGSIIMWNGDNVPLSRRKKSDFLNLISSNK